MGWLHCQTSFCVTDDGHDESKQKEKTEQKRNEGNEPQRARSVLINHDWLIQSPLVFSPSLPRSRSLLYGLITEMYSVSHYVSSSIRHPPSFSPSLPIVIRHSPAASVYSSIPWKGGCQSPSAALPSSNTSLHLSFYPSITFSPLFFLLLWGSFILHTISLAPSSFPSFLCILTDLSFPVCLSKRKTQISHSGCLPVSLFVHLLLSLSASARVDTASF